MTTPQLCTNCGERPAVSGKATVPLCSVCEDLAKGKERGVKMAPKAPSPPKSGKRLSLR
jgi:hypothetical protein